MTLKNLLKLCICFVITFLAAGIGSLATSTGLDSWYKKLDTPPLNPPSWVFAPVWTTLYCLMAVALYIVWTKSSASSKTPAYISFGIQIVLNALWSLAFFGLENPWLGVVVIVMLLFAIIATMVMFGRVSRLAVYLLIPYIVWVLFATYLNVSIAVTN